MSGYHSFYPFRNREQSGIDPGKIVPPNIFHSIAKEDRSDIWSKQSVSALSNFGSIVNVHLNWPIPFIRKGKSILKKLKFSPPKL